MKNAPDINALKTRIETMLPTLNEYQRRRYLSIEAKTLGRGGITLINQLTKTSRQTLTNGIKEINNPKTQIPKQGKSRKPGGGRKPIWEEKPKILQDLKELLQAHTKDDPIRPLLWTNKSRRKLAQALKEQDYHANKDTVGLMLKMMGYGLQADKKTLTVNPSHPDRDVQFEHINTQTQKAIAEGNPVLSIDAKKKENIGNFKNNGQTYQPHRTPVEVLDHEFPIKELGKATPFGVYNIFKNQGFVSVGLSCDTAVFAVESIRKWWYAEGAVEYGGASRVVLTCDCGGSNGYRSRLWKFELSKLADEIGLDIVVLHYPPGTSKWNKVEHRLFSFISRNWAGVPLVSAAVIVSLIGATKTQSGLCVRCVLDEETYERGLEVSDEEFESISIVEDDFHGEWNYTICKKS
jgi:hypothetical protein